ncbi:MAG: hypothetical protein DWQ01_13235 [Planctomycetota bacterium]|nr:MAG: hypothetical protein DWQ01_13235 [Planctomycetota bacterium]
MIFRKRKSGRLVLHGGPEFRWQRRLAPQRLEAWLQELCRRNGVLAEIAWQKTGSLGTRFLLQDWPEMLSKPRAAFLRQADKGHLVLQVELPAQTDLEEYGEDLLAFLEGRQQVQRFDLEAEAVDEEPAAVFELSNPSTISQEERPAGESEGALTQSSPKPTEPTEPEEAEAPVDTDRKFWRIREDDLFTLVGPVHPEDVFDEGLELQEQDLGWLNYGDHLLSERRGRCRIFDFEWDAEELVAVFVERPRGDTLRIGRRELLAEFRYDDEGGF